MEPDRYVSFVVRLSSQSPIACDVAWLSIFKTVIAVIGAGALVHVFNRIKTRCLLLWLLGFGFVMRRRRLHFSRSVQTNREKDNAADT
jgi:hypothetical protein